MKFKRATGLAVEQERPGYVLKARAGSRLDPGRRAWRQAAAQIEQSRHTYQVPDPVWDLGPEPQDRAQQADRQRARTAIDRVHLLAGTDADRPVVAVRVRATVGRPGGSAQAARRRARATEWAAWTRTLPGGQPPPSASPPPAASSTACWPRAGLVLGGLAAVAAGWGCGSGPAQTPSPGDGGGGERRTARLPSPSSDTGG